MFLLESLGSFRLIYHVMLLILLAEVVLVSVTNRGKTCIAGLSNSKDAIAIYVGDDRTDEDAFKVKVLADRFITVQIGKFSHSRMILCASYLFISEGRI